MINLENYEAYLLDYIEGNLSPEETDMLLAFLEENPHLQDEVAGYADITLSPTTEGFNKKSLFKTDVAKDAITIDNHEEFAIAHLEGELPADRMADLKAIEARHPQLEKDAALVAMSTLTPDENIVYIDKGDLKRSVPFFIPYQRIVGVAAALLLAVYFFLPDDNNGTLPSETVATNPITTNENSVSENPITNEQRAEVLPLANNTTIEEETVNTVEKEKTSSIQEENKLEEPTLSPIQEILKKESYADITPAPSLLASLTTASSNRNVVGSIPVDEIPVYYEEENKTVMNRVEKYLSPKEFLTSLFKKDVLKSEDKGTTIVAEDFNNTLASVTNDKVTFKKNDNNKRLLSIQTKNFSFEKTIGK